MTSYIELSLVRTLSNKTEDLLRNYIHIFLLLLGSTENEDNPLLMIDSNTSTLLLAVLAVIMIFISGFIP